MLMVASLGCTSDDSNGSGTSPFQQGGTGGVAGTPASGGTGGTAGTVAGVGATGGTAGTTAGVGATGGASGDVGGASGIGGTTGGAGGAGGTMAGTGGMTGGTGMMMGGTGGAMGGAGGTGSGDSCVETTVANAPPGSTTPECAACLCEKCTEELDGCYPADNPTWAGQCRALVQCGKEAPCCGKSCYGDYDFVTMTGTGPCVQEVYDAGGGKMAVESTPGSCDAVGPPAGNACAASKVFGHCTATNCKAECMSPCNPADFMLPGGF